jgi:hypothetical protein
LRAFHISFSVFLCLSAFIKLRPRVYSEEES